MSETIYEQGGIYLTKFTGPARTDGDSRAMVQLTNRSLPFVDDGADTVMMSVAQFDAMRGWFWRNDLSGVRAWLDRRRNEAT